MPRKISLNKMGLLVGSGVAVLLISYHVLAAPAHLRRETFLSSLGIFMFLGVFCGEAMSGLFIANYIGTRLRKRGAIWGCIIGGVLISPLAVVGGIAFGTMSLGLGTMAGSLLGMRELGIYGVMCVYIMLVIIVLECGAAGIGSFLGYLIQRIGEWIFTSKDNV